MNDNDGVHSRTLNNNYLTNGSVPLLPVPEENLKSTERKAILRQVSDRHGV